VCLQVRSDSGSLKLWILVVHSDGCIAMEYMGIFALIQLALVGIFDGARSIEQFMCSIEQTQL